MIATVKKPRPINNKPVVPTSEIYQLSTAQFLAMRDQNILPRDGKFELIDGRIVEIMEGNPPHETAVSFLNMHFMLMFWSRFVIRCQQTFPLRHSVVIPDLLIARGQIADYAKHHPTVADALLVVEVADSSLADDLVVKRDLYAASKVAQYWVVNLVDRQIHVFTQPKGGKKPGYKLQVDYGEKDTIPVVLAGERVGELKVQEVLP